jgi:hypothetical protein
MAPVPGDVTPSALANIIIAPKVHADVPTQKDRVHPLAIRLAVVVAPKPATQRKNNAQDERGVSVDTHVAKPIPQTAVRTRSDFREYRINVTAIRLDIYMRPAVKYSI